MKYLNSIYLRQTVDFLQRYGLKSVLNKIPEYMMTTRGYQAWRKEHAPSEEELARQKRISVDMPARPLFSILVPTFNTNPLQLRQMAESVFSQTYDNWELCIADGSPRPSSGESSGPSTDGNPKSSSGESLRPSRVVEFFLNYAMEHDLSVVTSCAESTISDISAVPPIIHSFACKAHGRVWIAEIENHGIAGNTNAAMALATGDYIVLLDHDDLLSPDALFEIANAINEDPAIDVIYSDEDMVSADGSFLHNPNFKPDFSPDLLRSCNYITHLYATRRSLALSVGGFSQDCDGSQDFDFTLKTTELAERVCHIPKVLYHWRVHSNSVAADSGNKAYAYDSAVRALEQHYARTGVKASVTKDPQPGFYLTDYAIKGRPLVSVLMYNCSGNVVKTITEAINNDVSYDAKSCTKAASASTSCLSRPSRNLESSQSSSSLSEAPFKLEFPRSMSETRGEYILVLRQVQDIAPDTIRLLLSNCMRPEIGIAVPRILTSDGKVAESGLIYNMDGEIISPFAGKDPVYPGYHCYALCQHQVSLAGPCCFMTSMENLRQNWQSRNESQSRQCMDGSDDAGKKQINNAQKNKTLHNSEQDLVLKNPYVRMAEFSLRTRQDHKLITVIPRATVTLTKQGNRDVQKELREANTQKGYGEVAALNCTTQQLSDPYYTPNFSQTHPYSF